MTPPLLIDRRRFLTGSAAVAAAAMVWRSSPVGALDVPPVSLPGDPFSLGVGSGDPLPDRVVLWTRLRPGTNETPLVMPAVDVPVDWQMSLDPTFGTLAASGTSIAPAMFAHSVHVDADGLDPDTWYFYRFQVDGYTSPVGRTRTAPAADADVARMAFGFVSCQNFGNGYYNAHHFLSGEDIDVVFHLGDYIYESTGSRIRTVFPGGEARTLTGYRNRYATYRYDPDLQASHQACPWVVIWDDHEVDNDYANDISEQNDPVEEFLVRRAEAYLAWWEHQAVRMPAPVGPDLPIHRSFQWGRLASFFALDTRQYRSNQKLPSPGPLITPEADEGRTLLGTEQEAWLTNGLTSSTSTWNVIAQQVIVSAVNLARVLGNPAIQFYNQDQWDGYPGARQRLLDVLAQPQVRNPLVLTGDIHASGASYLLRRFDDTPRGRIVGHEFVGTSVSSSFPPELMGLFAGLADVVEWLRYANPSKRGYVLVELTPENATAAWRTVSTIDVRHVDGEGQPNPLVTVDSDHVWVIPARAEGDNAPRFVPAGFDDVPAGSFFDQAVNWLKANGITTGFGGSTTEFAPDAVVNRGQMAAFLWRMMDRPTGAPPALFDDVLPDAFYAVAVDWLKANGITTGFGGSTTEFAPDAVVSRGQMAAFLWRTAGESAPSARHTFDDVAMSDFFDDAVSWLVEHGITTGFGGSATEFVPDAPVTRSQMAAFLFRLAQADAAWTVAKPASTEF